jgi:serine/threonine protein kinase
LLLHSNDIHRDVTPGNLLISRASNGNTHVLIADLGVAKSTVDAVGATMTAGTPSYMAPEQAICVTLETIMTARPSLRIESRRSRHSKAHPSR